jgi:uncharacterized membrane protein
MTLAMTMAMALALAMTMAMVLALALAMKNYVKNIIFFIFHRKHFYKYFYRLIQISIMSYVNIIFAKYVFEFFLLPKYLYQLSQNFRKIMKNHCLFGKS